MARNNANRPMSIDAMLDMERKEVLALLESKGQAPSSSPERVRSASPYTPRSPVRSMLDIAEEEAGPSRPAPPRAPVRSMLDIDSPPPSPRPVSAQVVRSMLDSDASGPPSAPIPVKHPIPQQQGSRTTPNSPATSTDPAFKAQPGSSATHGRAMSDAAFKPVEFGPRAAGTSGGRNDHTSQYQFSGIYSNTSGGQQMPKRNTQGKWQPGGSMGQALRNSDMSGLQLPSERARHSSLSGRLGSSSKSKSPHNRLANRSRSPAAFVPLGPNKAMLDDGQVVDISSAYRRLSDANLAFSSGSLAQLPSRLRSDEAGEGRLIKDYLGPDGEHLGSSDEDDEPYSTDDEDRGRKKDPRALNPGARGESGESTSRSRSNRRDRKTLSLLAAAEEERTQVASKHKYKYKSLIPEPEIKVTTSSGETVKPSKNAVHPNTSYDQGFGSATPSVIDSDDEADMDDIKRAQKLSFSMTNILTSPDSHRAIRIIYRGEYNKIVQAAEDEHHRLRKYLVATDLSDESAHAMEWAIGTVLRDGDTLIAIYCVDEETGIVTEDGALVPDESKAMKEQAAAINSVANAKAAPAPTSLVTEFKRPSALHFRTDSASTPGSSPAPAAQGSKADEERQLAVQHVTDRVLRLLRKTRLQVKVVVEVLHCKNPKHLITEVIDLVNPTLVVIGSRGRSALKGVILGSFSNYLVTKSSVPVMVARKRLRKQSQYKKAGARQVNNLSNPVARSLASAKID